MVLVVSALMGAYLGPNGIKNAAYRIHQGYGAFMSLYDIPVEELDAFVEAFKIFERTENEFYVNNEDDYKQVKNYYQVLNRLCTLGSVEKMYIPPIIDPKVGVFENQMLFEEGFADALNVGPGKKLLEIGCGRGRISHHVATRTGANVLATNIDPTQLEIARKYANESGLLGRQLEFQVANMNEPLPFPNETFDGFYQVQAMTYAKDLRLVFGEISRVLKPGARLSVLDGVILTVTTPATFSTGSCSTRRDRSRASAAFGTTTSGRRLSRTAVSRCSSTPTRAWAGTSTRSSYRSCGSSREWLTSSGS